MQNPFDLQPFVCGTHTFRLDPGAAVADLQNVILDLRQRKLFRYFAFGMILHQELFRLFLPDLGNAGLLQTIKVLKHRHLDLPVNDKADLKRRFHTEHPHFSVLIHPRLHAYLCKLRKNLMVHSFLRSLALRPPLKRQGSLYPVCFFPPLHHKEQTA